MKSTSKHRKIKSRESSDFYSIHFISRAMKIHHLSVFGLYYVHIKFQFSSFGFLQVTGYRVTSSRMTITYTRSESWQVACLSFQWRFHCENKSSPSSCHQTIVFHSSTHCFPTSFNLMMSSKEQGCSHVVVLSLSMRISWYPMCWDRGFW